MLRGAVIGLGNVAIHGHLPGWLGRPDVRIVAAADARPAQRALCEARLPGARWYDSPEDLLAGEPLDFVDICTPPSSHAELTLRALDRSLHVLCEKPLVSSPGDLRRVTEAAASAGRVLHTVHNWHHAPILSLTADPSGRGRSVGCGALSGRRCA
jgi:predicted dehydrogenase